MTSNSAAGLGFRSGTLQPIAPRFLLSGRWFANLSVEPGAWRSGRKHSTPSCKAAKSIKGMLAESPSRSLRNRSTIIDSRPPRHRIVQAWGSVGEWWSLSLPLTSGFSLTCLASFFSAAIAARVRLEVQDGSSTLLVWSINQRSGWLAEMTFCSLADGLVAPWNWGMRAVAVRMFYSSLWTFINQPWLGESYKGGGNARAKRARPDVEFLVSIWWYPEL